MTPRTSPLRPPTAPRALRAPGLALLAALACAVLASVAPTASGATAPAPRWPAEALSAAAHLPIQEGGRIMPLGTFADVLLLRLNHRKDGADADGNALTSVEVVLDLLLRPEVADRHPIFVVDDAAVLDAIGVTQAAGKHKRDRYAFLDLSGALERLWAKADAYEQVARRQRSHVEDGVVDLRGNVRSYLELRTYLEFARGSLDPASAPGLLELFPDGKPARFTALLAVVPRLRVAAQGDGAPADVARELLASLAQQGRFASGLASIPPAVPAAQAPVWRRPSEVIEAALAGQEVEAEALAVLRGWEAVAAVADDPPAAARALEDVAGLVHGLAAARGEGDRISLEVFLNDLNPFRKALWGYVVAFLLLAATWLWRQRWVVRAGAALTAGALLLHVAGIVIRCVLRGRPPMLTLYDTTLFISAFAVLASLVTERVSGRGIALAAAPFLGALGLFVSNRYEEIHASDTMPQVMAVLDTNFWLSTHVTCIGIGYSATFVASLFAHVHVLGRVLGGARMTADTERAVARMTYGVVCFALFFSVVGTILGGIWANESWGRFWGWDPKENGALLICLVQLASLHGRLGGPNARPLWRSFGFALVTIFAGCVVAFSWWGVNLLEIGLHSYGFTKGVWTGLLTFWGVEAAVIAAGVVHAKLTRDAVPPSA